jgi:carboxylesterase
MAMTLTAYQGSEHQPFLWLGEGAGTALLIHGFPGTAAEMRGPAQALHQQGWTVQGLVLPGFGPAFPTITRYTQADWVAAVAEAAATLRQRTRPLLLVGNSMGAALALQTAASQAVDGLVLFSPFWRTNQRLLDLGYPLLRWVIPELRPFTQADFADPQVRAGFERIITGADFDDPAVQAAIRKLALPTRVLGEVRQAGQLGSRAAPLVRTPTLIIQGADDPVAVPALTRQLAQRLPGLAGYVEVQGGHELLSTESTAWSALALLLQQFAQSIQVSARSAV